MYCFANLIKLSFIGFSHKNFSFNNNLSWNDHFWKKENLGRCQWSMCQDDRDYKYSYSCLRDHNLITWINGKRSLLYQRIPKHFTPAKENKRIFIEGQTFARHQILVYGEPYYHCCEFWRWRTLHLTILT